MILIYKINMNFALKFCTLNLKSDSYLLRDVKKRFEDFNGNWLFCDEKNVSISPLIC